MYANKISLINFPTYRSLKIYKVYRLCRYDVSNINVHSLNRLRAIYIFFLHLFCKLGSCLTSQAFK